jgi:hypothetical protein
MNTQDELRALHAALAERDVRLDALAAALGVLQDKDEIRQLQYTYGYLIDNRMFREMADLFAAEGAWMEIGNRGRYLGRERIHDFLLEVLGGGRWGLARDEVINHVQQQMVITIADDRQHARARSRAQVQGNSPPGTSFLLLADGISKQYCENWRWKILGITVTMTTRLAGAIDRRLARRGTAAPDLLSQQRPGLGRQFNPFIQYPLTGAVIPTQPPKPAQVNATRLRR